MLRGNRFRLVTLGRLTLLGPAGEEDASLARRRFKLAVLAVLAMARRPVARDALLGMFWAEQDEARARHSLSNALSSLRRSLGQRAITTRDTGVALAPDLELDVDALELAEAVEGRDFGRAIELYGGPFLEGVHVDDSVAFEQWVSRERRRLESLFVQACAQQCALLARARRWPECQEVAARWLDTEPLSSDAAIYLLNAIKAPATRAALARALEAYESLRIRLVREFELGPDGSVRELAERIREQLTALPPEPSEPTGIPAPVASSITPVDSSAIPAEARPFEVTSTPSASPEPPAAVPEPALPAPAVPAPGTAATSLPAGPPPSDASRRRVVWWTGGVVAAAALLIVAIPQIRGAASRPTAAGPSPVIAVMTMGVGSGDSSIVWLSDGLPQMIAGKLSRATGVEVVPGMQVRAVVERSGRDGLRRLDDTRSRDLARRVGATLVAGGTIARDGDRLVLDLTIHDVRSGDRIGSHVLTRGDALGLADEAAVRILGAAKVGAPGPQFSELETSSLAAYQHYMRSLEVGQAGRPSESKRELDAALTLDSGFITALDSRLTYAIWDNDTALVRRLRETLRRYASRATAFERAHQDAWAAFVGGERERSQALARNLVRQYPRDPRAYAALQGILSMHGEFEEAERVAAQWIAVDSLAIEAGSGPCAPCIGLQTIIGLHWVRRDLDGAAEWARRWIRAQPDGAFSWAALAWTYSYLQRPDSALPLMQRAVSLSGDEVWAAAEYARMLLVARRYAAADSAIAVMEASTSSDRLEAAADLRVMLEREYGRLRSSNRAVDRMVRASHTGTTAAEMMRADNLRLLGQHREASRRFDVLVHMPRERLTFPLPPGSARAFCWHHALAADAMAATRDTMALRAQADTLEQGCGRSYYGRDWRLYHHVRGLIAMIGGRFAEAEQEFTQAIWAPAEGWARTTVELAEAQAAQGRYADAVATLRTGYVTRLDAMGRYVPISELDFRMARTFARWGERDSALVYAGFVRRAWREADPEIRRLLDQLP